MVTGGDGWSSNSVVMAQMVSRWLVVMAGGYGQGVVKIIHKKITINDIKTFL